MSAFAIIYSPALSVNTEQLDSIMPRLSHRGPDGKDTHYTKYAVMGHWHFWTTPEEIGEKQPLEVKGLPFIITFDGRLDNRAELFKKLNIPAEEGKTLSDAVLTLYAYKKWEEKTPEHFIGEFAFAILDEDKKQLFCARDHLGDRTLFYANQGEQTIIASEPWAVAGAFDETIG